jgi:hypothetical protein
MKTLVGLFALLASIFLRLAVGAAEARSAPARPTCDRRTRLGRIFAAGHFGARGVIRREENDAQALAHRLGACGHARARLNDVFTNPANGATVIIHSAYEFTDRLISGDPNGLNTHEWTFKGAGQVIRAAHGGVPSHDSGYLVVDNTS